jgi:hypothetical protein
VPDVVASLASFDLDHAGPSWLAAVETVVEAWLEAADYEAAERALDRMKARLEHGAASRLARATESLLRARLLLALDRKDDAIVAGERTLAAIDAGAPWSRAKAIRILEEAGGVTAPLIEEARAIEAGLGIPATSRLVRPAPASPE